MAETYGEWARVTFGQVSAEPGARNTVPERVRLSIDLRHPEQTKLLAMDEELRRIVDEESARIGVESDLALHWSSPAVEFDPHCLALVESAIVNTGEPWMQLVSGAGHDSVYVSKVAPTAMIFIPCQGGLSHNAKENISLDQAALGAEVLLNVLVAAANE